MMLDHCDERVNVGRSKPKLGANLTNQIHTDSRVVTRISLPQVVE